MKIIDVHHHVIGRNNPNFDKLPKWDMQIDAEENERLGISAALLSLPVSSTPEQTRAINGFLADFAAYDRKKYGMLACLPAADSEAALREIEYSLDSLQADGFCMPSNAQGIYPGDDCMDEVLAELDRRNAVVLLHPVKPAEKIPQLSIMDPSAFEFPFDTTRALMDLVYRGKILKYPNIRWIAAHAGGVVPFLLYRLSTVVEENKSVTISSHDILKSLERIYFDLALSTSPIVFSALKQAVEHKNILFGTDAPLRPKKGTAESVEIFKNADAFTEDEKIAIASGNATSLFPRLLKHIQNS